MPPQAFQVSNKRKQINYVLQWLNLLALPHPLIKHKYSNKNDKITAIEKILILVNIEFTNAEHLLLTFSVLELKANWKQV